MIILLVARILYSLNVSLPKLPKINVEHEPAPERRSSKSSNSSHEVKPASDSDLFKKLEQAT
jgi:hypothetical protein